MNPIILFLFGLFLHSNPVWQTNFDQAKQEAKVSHKYILLNFSGSDWCTPCIRMHKTIFEDNSFTSYADKQLVLVNADFPRLRKNQLPAEQQKQNDTLAEQYNSSGKFPYTLLLDENGKVIRAWEGCPNESPEAFVQEVNNGLHSGK